jgi:polar amino acid transport system permease protein
VAARTEPRAVAAAVLAACSLVVPVVPAVGAFLLAARAETRIADADGELDGFGLVDLARRLATVGLFVGVGLLLALWAWSSQDRLARLGEVYFDRRIFGESFPAVLKGFRSNVTLFLVAEALVLVFGLLLALARLVPGTAAAPLRWLATAYVDAFRSIPAILVIYLVGFGGPIALDPPPDSLLRSFWVLGVIGLTLVYSAYVAEVYRAGIESVHWSQAAAARSLGLGAWATYRHVVLPQAVRRVIPPLMNDFIGLQKDTALVSVIGLIEGFRAAQLQGGKFFNSTPLTALALCFIVITIPMTRFTDWLLRRDQQRMQARA